MSNICGLAFLPALLYVYIPVFGGKRQGIDGARQVQKIAALGSANVPRRVAADGSVADSQRHQVAGPFATSVDSDALVMAAPLASQSSQNQTLVGHDYLGAGIVHKSPILEAAKEKRKKKTKN